MQMKKEGYILFCNFKKVFDTSAALLEYLSSDLKRLNHSKKFFFQSKYSEHIKIAIWILNTDFDFNEKTWFAQNLQTSVAKSDPILREEKILNLPEKFSPSPPFFHLT